MTPFLAEITDKIIENNEKHSLTKKSLSSRKLYFSSLNLKKIGADTADVCWIHLITQRVTCTCELELVMRANL